MSDHCKFILKQSDYSLSFYMGDSQLDCASLTICWWKTRARSLIDKYMADPSLLLLIENNIVKSHIVFSRLAERLQMSTRCVYKLTSTTSTWGRGEILSRLMLKKGDLLAVIFCLGSRLSLLRHFWTSNLASLACSRL